LLLKILVVFFTILILVFWVFNLKNVWKTDKEMSANNKNQKSLTELSADFNKVLSEIQVGLNQVDENKVSREATSTDFLTNLVKSVNSSSSVNIASTSENISSSTKIISPTNTVDLNSTSSETLFNSKEGNCPKYINCMPIIGSQVRSCQIPSGCENITTLVY
jgi:predicted RND superfamily exporter protein